MKKEKQIKENLSNEINPEVQDPLTEVLREGARKMLALAIEAEVEEFINQYHTLKDERGRRAIVRNGYLPERDILTGLGSIPVSVLRVRDRRKEVSQPVQFTSSILPKYLRKTKSMEELIPWLYLKGVSTNDFPEALQALLGTDAPGICETVCRLKSKWQEEYNTWRRRDLSGKHYIYWWVDGVYLNTPIKERTCVLLIIGATAEGEKELLALEDGYRESEQSWIEYSGSESQRFRKRTIMCSGRWSYGVLERSPGI